MEGIAVASLKNIDAAKVFALMEGRQKQAAMVLKMRNIMMNVVSKFEGKLIDKRFSNAVNAELQKEFSAGSLQWSASVREVAGMYNLRFVPSWMQSADFKYESIEFFICYAGPCMNPGNKEANYDKRIHASGIAFSNPYCFNGLEKAVDKDMPSLLQHAANAIEKMNAAIDMLKEANLFFAANDYDYAVKLSDRY